MSFTIGSLFDGSGGFPLAAFMCKGTPVWASEIEPYPIAVTKTRFPYMKHLGSVTDIKGNEVEPVDVITFGSPCQDLSVAGKRAGLKHTDNGDDETTRSGLFMEAVRIIKEMREATGGKYPRFALWENVPGAFSSNKGEDFRVVCEELIKIVEPTAAMPTVPQSGWNYADYYCGDGWSLAYRVLDAQFWGVPQRRRRIYLVLDLGGERAGEVLFKREGLRGYFEEGRTPWQTTPGDAENCTGAADCERECVTLEPGIAAREGGHIYEGVCGTLRANAGDNQMAVAYKNMVLDDQSRIVIVDSIGGQSERGLEGEIAPTLKATHCKCAPCVVVSAGFCTEHSAKSRSIGFQEEVAPTLRAGVTPDEYIVRRLTTTECASLQGFPDRWGYPDHKPILSDEEYEFWLNVRNTHAAINGKATKEYTKAQMTIWYNKLHTDSSEYKMWGNGIALPTALYVMQGIAEVLR